MSNMDILSMLTARMEHQIFIIELSSFCFFIWIQKK